MEKSLRITAAGLAFGLALGAPLSAVAASSAHRTFDGTVVHISGNNIKVKGTEGGKEQTLSFLYVPRIGKIAHSGGQVTKTQEKLHVGEYVRVTYDQKLLGMRHADSVMAHSVGKMKM